MVWLGVFNLAIQGTMIMRYEITENGNLKLIAEDGDSDELGTDSNFYLDDLFEHESLIGNGWDISTADQIGALSEAPIIMQNIYLDGDGEYEFHSDSKVWFYNDYMINCPIETMLEYGEVIFTKLDIKKD